MSFFESPIVQEEIVQIAKLGEVISENVLIFPTLSELEQAKRVETMQQMLDRIRLFYTRLSLSEDADAQEMKEKIDLCSGLMGCEGNIQGAFNNIQELIDRMKEQLDKQ